ncbi:putative transcriptional regulator [Bosea sp. BE271]|uniref:CopG family ribbon-helix-helix protein n=1 Tax=Bosea TaxID=85413 RepID=UPI00285FF3B1|nr:MULTISPECIES: ribbon-helix-helix protein, CopG family [Bosea]MDR6829020.1 putative transcriptional regulator [Bosea robiniae]MDR6895904.1 putative transcriptional regulator [Bosea sp. BE109]MDR7139301.1 putative transcriptional regulator [Bosea sp. BE168]MDR7175999.1 putative transcriptional regulator [Bosea sp. BE271]
MSKVELSDPIALRIPVDVLGDIEKIAAVSERTRSWVIVRALRLYLASEGADCLAIIRGREEAAEGGGHDADDVLGELESIVRSKLA